MDPELYETSFIQRWHTHPTLARLGQTLGHHQWGVATLIAQLHPQPSAGILMAALWHDVGERGSGDIPYNAKRQNPELAYQARKAEKRTAERLTRLRLNLSDYDETWLTMCDRLEAYLYVKTVAPHLLETEEWHECLCDIFEKAENLGVYDEVAELVD